MGLLFQGKVAHIQQSTGLCEEVVTKMQAVLEETLLKNFQLSACLFAYCTLNDHLSRERSGTYWKPSSFLDGRK